MTKSIALTGPPASGKTTAYYDLLERGWRPTPSHMTRAPRSGEIHGRDGVFITPEEFEARFAAGDYLEPSLDWAGYNGNYYGSPRAWVEEIRTGGAIFMPSNVLATRSLRTALDSADIQGGLLWVHLRASPDARRERLVGRGDEPSDIELRLVRGDTHESPPDADLHIDTTHLTPLQVTAKIISSTQQER